MIPTKPSGYSVPDALSEWSVKFWSYVEAAAIPEAFVTAHEALIHLGMLVAGGWALIHAAAGGVGSAAVMLARALGAKTVFTASGDRRIERVRELGGTVGVDYRKKDFVEAALQATGGRGVDVVVDFIGGSYLDRNLRSLAPGGTTSPGRRIGRWGRATLARSAAPPLSAHYRHGNEVAQF